MEKAFKKSIKKQIASFQKDVILYYEFMRYGEIRSLSFDRKTKEFHYSRHKARTSKTF
jgi:hypothetical protein